MSVVLIALFSLPIGAMETEKKLTQEQMRISRIKPPRKNKPQAAESGILQIPMRTVNERNNNRLFVDCQKTCLNNLLSHASADKSNALQGKYPFPYLQVRDFNYIMNYCLQPQKVSMYHKQLKKKEFQVLCGLWTAADFLQPKNAKIDENNNNCSLNQNQKNELAVLKSIIEKECAVRLHENLSDETIEAVKQSTLPPILEHQLNSYCANVDVDTAGIIIMPREGSSDAISVSARGNLLMRATTFMQPRIIFYSFNGEEIGGLLPEKKDNPIFALSDDETVCAFAHTDKLIKIVNVKENFKEVVDIHDKNDPVELLKFSSQNNYLAIIRSMVDWSRLGYQFKQFDLYDLQLNEMKRVEDKLCQNITNINFSNDEKIIAINEVLPYSAIKYDIDGKKTELIGKRVSLHPFENTCALWDRECGIVLETNGKRETLFELTNVQNCELLFDASGTNLMVCYTKNISDKKYIKVFNLIMNEMREHEFECDNDSPVEMYRNWLIAKCDNQLVATSLTTNKVIQLGKCPKLVFSKNGKRAVVVEGSWLYALKFKINADSLRLHEVLQKIKNEQENPASGNELIKQSEGGAIPYNFDLTSDTDEYEKRSGKDEHEEDELS